jgi:hypothetical protein
MNWNFEWGRARLADGWQAIAADNLRQISR